MRFIPVRIAAGQSNYKPLGVRRFCAWVEEKNEICPGSFCFNGFQRAKRRFIQVQRGQKGDLSRVQRTESEIYPGSKRRFIQVEGNEK
jgi:hypothetical protein